jgi:hypothetical protein
VDLTVDGAPIAANFVKVAVNVMRRKGSTKNELPVILRRWFGSQAGHPGTDRQVVFEMRGDAFEMRPFEVAGREVEQLADQ